MCSFTNYEGDGDSKWSGLAQGYMFTGWTFKPNDYTIDTIECRRVENTYWIGITFSI